MKFWTEGVGKDFSIDLLQLVTASRDLDTTDPQDKIYILIGLAKLLSGFEIDYTIPVETVYISFVQACIEQSNSLAILREASLVLAPRDIEMWLPSWVPDWRFKGDVNRVLFKFHALLETKASAAVSSSQLSAWGILIDVITEIEPLSTIQDKGFGNFLALATSRSE